MNFVSAKFLIFLLLCWLTFVIVQPRFRIALLLIASYVFYAAWSIPFIGIILFTTSIDYAASIFICNQKEPKLRRLALIVAITLNLAVLIAFKYFNFCLDIGWSLLNVLHLSSEHATHLQILLPLGISYFTFEAISYVVDVYRGKRPAMSWIRYNFYIMYFPHLVSGPIIRFDDLSRQMDLPLSLPSAAKFEKAIELIVFGYFFKIVLADQCSIPANALFNAPGQASILQTYSGVLAFAAQLYFDFLAYTQIARGVSLLFNLELPSNFNHPTLATNIANFWQRWQISLSRWLFDYLYRPLGGFSKSLGRRMIAAFLTLFIAGLWHGAGWTFALLGAYYGACVSIYHAYRAWRKSYFTGNQAFLSSKMYRITSIMLTFFVSTFSVIFFRSPDLNVINAIIAKLFRLSGLIKEIISTSFSGDYKQILLIMFFPLITSTAPLWVRLYNSRIKIMPYWFKWQAATFVGFFCWIMYTPSSKTFIYFQF